MPLIDIVGIFYEGRRPDQQHAADLIFMSFARHTDGVIRLAFFFGIGY